MLVLDFIILWLPLLQHQKMVPPCTEFLTVYINFFLPKYTGKLNENILTGNKNYCESVKRIELKYQKMATLY